MNYTLSLDDTITHQLEALAPHKSAYGLDEPRVISGNLAAPKPHVSTKSSWIHDEELNVPNPAILERMMAFAA